MTPCFSSAVEFRFDHNRQKWVLLSPERMFLPDENAVAVLKLIDGDRSNEEIIDILAKDYDAPREEIASDVAAMLDDLLAMGVIYFGWIGLL